MPKSPFVTSLWGDEDATLTLRLLGPEELPPPKSDKLAVKPTAVKKPRPPKQPRKVKKSTLVSRFKKQGKVSAAKEKPVTVIPKELIEQQEDDERSKKRRYSKFHPREGEQVLKPQRKETVEPAPGQANNADYIKRHNSHVNSKTKSSTVLNRLPASTQASLKPLLDNQKLGMSHDVENLERRTLELRTKAARLGKQLRNFAGYIPAKDMKAKQYSKHVESLVKLSNDMAEHGELVKRTTRYLVTKAVFETRHARTIPNSTLTNLSYEPATTRCAEELNNRLKRTPLERGYKEHEEEANTVLSRHISTLKTELEHSRQIATPLETLAAAQTGILNTYRECIKNATTLSEEERTAYQRDLKAVTRLMKLVMSEKRRLQEQVPAE